METRPGLLVRLGSAVTGVVVLVIGVGLLTAVDTAFGAVGAALFVVLGLASLISSAALKLPVLRDGAPAQATTYDGEDASYYPRRSRRSAAGYLVLILLGGWVVALGLVGALTEDWLWPVLAAPIAAFLLGPPVLAMTGRLGPGGVWLTPTRIVNLEQGVRSEMAFRDVDGAVTNRGDVRIYPTTEAGLRNTTVTPRIWRGAVPERSLVVTTAGTALDSEELAAELRRRVALAHGDESPRAGPWWGRSD